ncbi:asparagine synthase (glutamine-hydrolyzing) [Roseateles saccharophilus]|uniref:asparagine synthase (glutamine-hydrolyzing) n=1 Tax=Roseateles saccharophilus TaxID=304 RepID=A0A4R3UPZ7_ROSSA|nr:asparagine synthase (glutamine-hydrolyzing) [Roseateles saccharophilus]MDG0833427.1 asparagine synthase (glutamine-hydrolyzing) [Roseateles saccharophilus]TCU93082.1 asparagine synthase (glutamine-hydrolysing) [Roseateles saccharophilus]
MCGITGVVGVGEQDRADLSQLVQRMTRAIFHRGPDGGGHYADAQAALGHRRLAILDLSDAAAQPMHSAAGDLVLVFNGEIYNFVELRAELRTLGHEFHSSGDTEVLLKAYQQWGPDCVKRFNGMWAFAIWDARQRRLFLSRDRLGVKPLCYVERGGRFYFASEVVALRAVLELRDANAAKLHDYLAYGYRTNDGQTFFDGVRELAPGCNLEWHEGRASTACYWALPERPLALSTEEARERLHHLLEDAVRLRFRSDVPVALLQSGGIDSSVLATLINDGIESGALSASKVTAYSAVFPGHAVDESKDIQALLSTCPQINGVMLEAGASEVARDFEAYCEAMQEPMAGAASFMHWKLMEQVRASGTKVVINGQGADEAWAGYGVYIRGYRLLDLLMTRPAEAVRELAAIQREMGLSLSSTLAQTVKAMLGRRAASRWRAQFTEGTDAMLSSAFRRAHAANLPDLGMVWGGGNLDRHLRSQLSDYGFNQILHYEDQSSMSRGVEIRSPFVDYRLMELAFSLPADYKFSAGLTKRLLRETFGERVPAQIIRSGRKLGFGTPTSDWLAEAPMQRLVAELVESPDFQQRTLWNGRQLAARLRGGDQAPRGFPAWRFLMAAVWLKQNGIRNV